MYNTNLLDNLGLYSQVNKRIRWMPWQSEAKKDVIPAKSYGELGIKP